MRFAWLAVSVLVVLSATPAVAASKEELAKQIAEMSLSREGWNEMMAKITDDTEAALLAQIPDEKRREHLRKVYRTAMREMAIPYEEIIDLQLAMFVKYYSASELQELQKFYKTALGQKMLRVMPEMTRDVSAAMNQKIQSGMQQAMQKAFSEAGSFEQGAAAPTPAPAPAKKQPKK